MDKDSVLLTRKEYDRMTWKLEEGHEDKKALERVQAQLTAANKRMEELEKELAAWPRDAAEETLVSVLIARECDPDISAFTQSPSGRGYSHKIWMLREIAAEKITGTKAHRWLGYAQALCVIDGSMNLDKAKEINKAASEGQRARDVMEEK